MQNRPSKVILITGASSGIGKACAETLAQRHKVYGTSRKVQSQPSGYQMIEMDVTSDESVQKAIETILRENSRLDVLVSNAGMGFAGAIEDMSMTEAKNQLETNFFGTLRVAKAVLPQMRRQGGGQIINVSSIGGIISLPFQAMYCASKFAIEGLTEALRMEVRPFNIKVSMVEPGDFKTSFTQNRILSQGANSSSPYWQQMQTSLGIMEKDEKNGPSPVKVAAKVACLIRCSRPPLRVTVGMPLQRLAVLLKRWLPGCVFEMIMRSTYQI